MTLHYNFTVDECKGYDGEMATIDEPYDYYPTDYDVLYALAEIQILDLPMQGIIRNLDDETRKKLHKFFEGIIEDYDLYERMSEDYGDRLLDWFEDEAREAFDCR